ncbi:MAG: hypothetical protein JKY41_13370 [Rhodobacteraceae bacterium]|nr:hypothetical protein [Paracoccaceae bacterium]
MIPSGLPTDGTWATVIGSSKPNGAAVKTQHIQFTISLLAISLALLSAHWVELWPQLGAHPLWSGSTTYLGIGVGALLAVFSHVMLTKRPRWGILHLAIFASVAIIGITASTYGKIDFVASYAEDRLAGSIWYYGFVVFIAGMPGSFTMIVRLLRGPPA